MITIAQKIKIKFVADVSHHMFTKSVFYTPPITEKNKWISRINFLDDD